eukprot:3347868-Rhodomonas_salina.1
MSRGVCARMSPVQNQIPILEEGFVVTEGFSGLSQKRRMCRVESGGQCRALSQIVVKHCSKAQCHSGLEIGKYKQSRQISSPSKNSQFHVVLVVHMHLHRTALYWNESVHLETFLQSR